MGRIPRGVVFHPDDTKELVSPDRGVGEPEQRLAFREEIELSIDHPPQPVCDRFEVLRGLGGGLES